MTTLYLVRHATIDAVGNAIAGRRGDVSLNSAGREQLAPLAESLAREPIGRVFSSPLARARQTAEPLARRLERPLEIVEDLIELDFAEWTGRSFAELEELPDWRRFNTFRSGTRIPGGELMLEVQTRVVDWMLRLREELPDGHAVAVSHGDVIRAALTWALGMPLDLLQRIEVSPGSVSVVHLGRDSPTIRCLNLSAGT